MSRMERINEQLKNEIAMAVNERVGLEDGLITITQVSCSPNLQNATVKVSVLPENISGTALKKLRQTRRELSSLLKKKLRNLKMIPNLHFKIDNQERHAANMDKVFQDLKNDL